MVGSNPKRGPPSLHEKLELDGTITSVVGPYHTITDSGNAVLHLTLPRIRQYAAIGYHENRSSRIAVGLWRVARTTDRYPRQPRA